MENLFGAPPARETAPEYYLLYKDVFSTTNAMQACKGSIVRLINRSGHVCTVKTRWGAPFRVADTNLGERYYFPTNTPTPTLPAKGVAPTRLNPNPRTVRTTSRAAYKSVKDEIAAAQQREILEALVKGEGNAWQISLRCTGLDKVQTGRRLSELRDNGLAEETGTKAPSDTGRASVVYRITEAGSNSLI